MLPLMLTNAQSWHHEAQRRKGLAATNRKWGML